jgi:hypothetical protein
MRRAGPAAIAIAAVLSAASALAAPPPAPPGGPAATDVAVEVTPIFGAGTPLAPGWNEVVVRLTNGGAKPAKGQIEASAQGWGDGSPFTAVAPYTVAAGASVAVRVPVHVSMSSEVRVRVEDEAGRELSALGLPAHSRGGAPSPLLVDVSEPSRLRVAVNEVVLDPAHKPGSPSYGYAQPTQLAVGSPRFDPATGDPVLPDRAPLWAGAAAVVLRSERLAHLVGPELDALAGYVLGGGTLAIAVTRPEDLRHPTVIALCGAEPVAGAVAPATLRELVLPPPPSGSPGGMKTIEHAPSPSAQVAKALTGYAGGNLKPSVYGASAAYGLGEVHLLAFDPTATPAVDDPWAQARVVDLVRRATDRRSTRVYPGATEIEPDAARIRKQLDPNESSRWAIGAAALLLMAYAIVAGPVSFSFHARKGKPLAALRWLPIFAGIAFAIVVAIGVGSRGLRGRARHLTLVDAGAGVAEGAARRWRGFFTPRAKGLTVRTTDTASLLGTANVDDPGDRRDRLVVDRDGTRLVGVAALPWQTVVVREDGRGDLGAGITITPGAASGEAVVVNRSGRNLRAGLLVLPHAGATYFGRVRDGERVSTTAGRALSSTPAGRAWEAAVASPSSGTLRPAHRLDAHLLGPIVGDDAPGLADAWGAIETSAGNEVDWFPDDVPVLVAQLDGGEGRLADAGLKLESDRLLVRIVGWGGKP